MKKRGFTLVEIMIVVAIIILLAAIAIPNLLRARLNANESAAVGAMKTIVSAAISFRSVNNAYPTQLSNLSSVTPEYIDDVLGGGAKQGYNFWLAGSANTFTVNAKPQTYQTTGVRSFFADESGVIRATTADANATSSDTALE
jgi:prepilin-type N-terminal cleavage/methylation domain-containing protein